MRIADGFQATASIDSVKLHDQTLAAELRLQVSFPMPAQDEHLPHRIEAQVHAAGLEAQRCLFRALMEKADQEVVLESRAGDHGQGIQRRGTRPYTFVTDFGTVTIQRIRVSHRADGRAEIPSHTVWDTPQQVCITRGLRDAICDEMLAHSAGRSQADLSDRADQEELIARSTVLNVLHQEGAELLAAQQRRARAALDADPEARAVLLPLPPVTADTTDDDTAEVVPPGPAEPSVPLSHVIPVGFPGAAAAAAVATDEPRAVDPGMVLVELDEVKTKAQKSTGRKQVLTFTGLVLVGGLQYLLADGTAEGLFEQLAGLLCRLDVVDGTRQLLVLADGACWIRTWFEGLGLSDKTMIVCWYHVTKRCYEDLSGAGFAKERRESIHRHLLGLLWEGKVESAIAWLRGCRDEARKPDWIDGLIGYLEKRRPYLPNYKARKEAGLWIASTRVEKFNDWSVSQRCKWRGMSWTPQGVVALAELEAARRNGELDDWRHDRKLPDWKLPPKPLKPLKRTG
jgi:hypothetical protein